jgi:hypothetical protein
MDKAKIDDKMVEAMVKILSKKYEERLRMNERDIKISVSFSRGYSDERDIVARVFDTLQRKYGGVGEALKIMEKMSGEELVLLNDKMVSGEWLDKNLLGK